MSGSAGVTDCDLPLLYDDRNQPLALSILQHPVHRPLILRDVEVLELDPLDPIVRTGLRGVGSGVFAENQHFFLHLSPPNWIT